MKNGRKYAHFSFCDNWLWKMYGLFPFVTASQPSAGLIFAKIKLTFLESVNSPCSNQKYFAELIVKDARYDYS